MKKKTNKTMLAGSLSMTVVFLCIMWYDIQNILK